MTNFSMIFAKILRLSLLKSWPKTKRASSVCADEPARQSGESRQWWRWLWLRQFLISLSFPAVRAVAQQFLDLFRVQRFVAVSADPERLKQIARISNEGFDVKSLLSRNVKVVKKPTETTAVESVAAAEQLTGLTVQLPATLPRDVVQEQMFVVREGGALEFTADTSSAPGHLGRARLAGCAWCLSN
jgi:hypothetical protein